MERYGQLEREKDMYDKDLAIHKTDMPIIKLGDTIPFADDDGENRIDLVVTKIDSQQSKPTVVTLADKVDGDPVCYLHNTIEYKEKGA
jgi:alpha-galactosidase